MSSAHESIKSARLSIRQDLEDRWVTNLKEDRKGFFLIVSLLDPHTKSLSFCDDKHFPTSWKRHGEGHGFLGMEFESRTSRDYYELSMSTTLVVMSSVQYYALNSTYDNHRCTHQT